MEYVKRYGGIVATLVFGCTLLALPAHAVNSSDFVDCSDSKIAQSTICKEITANKDVWSIWKNILNAMIFVVGVIAVIMFVVGGLRYTTSGGDAKAVSDAKNILLYAAIGVALAFSGYAIVNWVVGTLSTPTTTNENRNIEDDSR